MFDTLHTSAGRASSCERLETSAGGEERLVLFSCWALSEGRVVGGIGRWRESPVTSEAHSATSVITINSKRPATVIDGCANHNVNADQVIGCEVQFEYLERGVDHTGGGRTLIDNAPLVPSSTPPLLSARVHELLHILDNRAQRLSW